MTDAALSAVTRPSRSICSSKTADRHLVNLRHTKHEAKQIHFLFPNAAITLEFCNQPP
jgi:hypothetical protein